MTDTQRQPLTRRGIPTDSTLRILALGQFATRFGDGAVLSTSAIYFTHMVGFSPTQVALAISFAGVLALMAQVPAGQLGDRRGPREVLAWLVLGIAVFAVPPAFATTPLILAVLLGLEFMFQGAAGAVNSGIIAQLARGGEGVLFKAYLRAVTNSAIALGGLLGGLALLLDQRWAFILVFVLNGVFTAFTAWNVTRLPHLPPVPRAEGEPRLAVLRDLPFVAVAAMTGAFTLHFVVMEIGIALYITARTEVPHVMVALLLVLNTVCVALFQVRMSRGSDSVSAAARQFLLGCVLIAVGFSVIGLSDWGPVPVAITLLTVGALVHVAGEMIGSGGQWGLQMGLAPHEKQGQYQGFAGLGYGVMKIIGPPIVAALCAGWGGPGWLVLAAFMLVIGLIAPPLARWALASRSAYGVTTHSG